jgi:hypothetical protein
MDRTEYINLLKKYLDSNISVKEHDELFSITSTENVDPVLSDIIDAELKTNSLAGADLPPFVSEEILRNILLSEKNTTKVLKLSKFSWRPWKIAASIVAVILISTYLLTSNSRDVISKVEVVIPKSNIEKINHTAFPLTVELSDGSKVTLHPEATISYPFRFTSNKREVYLKGEAFFEVAKNPSKPFFVYYNNIVTQVLGTSFTVKTNLNTNNVEVSVKTGKVQVYENKSLLPLKDKAKGVIVTQNQKAIYYSNQRAFETTLTDSLLPIVTETGMASNKKTETSAEFNYVKPTTLLDVFAQLRITYGVEIVVENDNIYNCLFSGDLSRKDVYKKLETICLTTDAEFEIKGTTILISGKGCN